MVFMKVGLKSKTQLSYYYFAFDVLLGRKK